MAGRYKKGIFKRLGKWKCYVILFTPKVKNICYNRKNIWSPLVHCSTPCLVSTLQASCTLCPSSTDTLRGSSVNLCPEIPSVSLTCCCCRLCPVNTVTSTSTDPGSIFILCHWSFTGVSYTVSKQLLFNSIHSSIASLKCKYIFTWGHVVVTWASKIFSMQWKIFFTKSQKYFHPTWSRRALRSPGVRLGRCSGHYCRPTTGSPAAQAASAQHPGQGGSRQHQAARQAADQDTELSCRQPQLTAAHYKPVPEIGPGRGGGVWV